MKTIVILSDTHGFLDPKIPVHITGCDEVWHAGDFGSVIISDSLADMAKLRGVYGNIDGKEIRSIHPENQLFTLEGIQVFMTHIGGYPGRYQPRVKQILQQEKPDLYICGHSHLCKVVRDTEIGLLHINPGAAGIEGLHHMKTIIKLVLDNGQIKDVRVIELGKRGKY